MHFLKVLSEMQLTNVSLPEKLYSTSLCIDLICS